MRRQDKRKPKRKSSWFARFIKWLEELDSSFGTLDSHESNTKKEIYRKVRSTGSSSRSDN